MAKKIIEMGQLGAPYGLSGWLKLRSYTCPANNITHYTNWYLHEKNTWKPVEILAIKPYHKLFIAKIATVDAPERAALLTNKQIGIDRQELPQLEQGQYYWSDLIGLSVINQQQQTLGKIDHLFETGSNDVIVVKNGKQSHLLPYHTSVVQSIDLEQGQMRVIWEVDF